MNVFEKQKRDFHEKEETGKERNDAVFRLEREEIKRT